MATATDQADLGVIDLTKVAAPDIRVKTKRADDSIDTWRVPGNAPSGLMVEMMVLLREIDAADEEDLELLADLRVQMQEKVDDLFALRNASYEDGDVKLGDEELGTLIAGLFRRYYGGKEPEADEESPTEPAEPAAETVAEEEPKASTPPRRRSEPRSRARSGKRKAPSRSSTSSPT